MVVILNGPRWGKKRPFYRVVAADQRMPRNGRFIEQLGTYDPRVEKGSIKLAMDRVEHWIKVGAQPSDTVKGLIKKFKTLAPAAV